ncbi:MAG TPA: OB-fold nucleic acid binding domain-containing protein [Terriglobales bacterium]|nr:OB-fold nucleic acid binding domain-containing protein [Terriglobales bacterium]
MSAEGQFAAAEPLKARFVEQLAPEERVTSAFLVKHKELRLKKDGEPYLSLILGDRTGDLEAKMWDGVAEVQNTFERDDFVKVRGVVGVFRDRLQLTIQKLRRLEEREISLADFLPTTGEDVEAMFAEVRGYAAACEEPHLRALLLAVLDDPAIAARFKRAPAAKSLHHAYFGGLLEHVRSLCRAARLIAQNYPGVDQDLLLAGIIWHDLGKIEELSYERSFAYTSEGQLLGHMVLALQMLHAKLAQLPDFPRPLQVALEHLIISHHGHYEFGSPKLPMFAEAVLLHFLDDLDSKMQAIAQQRRRDGLQPGHWTGYNASLERTILHLDRWLQPPAAAAPAAPPAGELDVQAKASRLQAALRGERS